ncbi:MAG: hypothetical protein F6K63_23395 [Moorea sp. SIO1G6]|uniref:hypothetical protein n=1 Tax=Moorena sp. SIO1G6 TaxID=2607840 RepID=UPI0013C1DF5C|nr:hypothetical protein [Moorena sp. SIO1G6]NET67169.1 hypothetical protein [Moorena sp. SIO1G6]
MGETTPVAHGGDHGKARVGETTAKREWGGTTAKREWGKPTAVAHGGNPQDRAASPRPRCLPKTALPPQDRAASLKRPSDKRCEHSQ